MKQHMNIFLFRSGVTAFVMINNYDVLTIYFYRFYLSKLRVYSGSGESSSSKILYEGNIMKQISIQHVSLGRMIFVLKSIVEKVNRFFLKRKITLCVI